MKNLIIILCVGVLCAFSMATKAQKTVPSAKMILVKAGNNQKDSTFITLDLSQKEPIILSYDQNYLHFSFINAKNPAQKSFSYQLVGLDYSWITCDSCSQVQYAHLNGGDYTFQVKTTQAGDIPTEFNFVVEGNVWHKWWFVPMLFLYFLVLIGVGVYFFVLYQFRQKLREQRLIHKEKMASMAELTSGIAHEIQNPLNFVNNFAEMSVDLVKELKEEIEKSDIDKEYIGEILGDLTQNQQKINHHGKRASAIVKGMLEHSRTTTGERRLMDIKKLVGENLRLSHHGFITKNKDSSTVRFNAEYETDFAVNLPQLNIIPQEMGKALLNLLNNAFYAVWQKGEGQWAASVEYKPMVVVSTSKNGNHIEIRIKDNGTGIPADVLPKIFQPFFTTKPTGEGTGLGLSLAYDIITKGHGGAIEVESVEGEGTTFVVRLPIT